MNIFDIAAILITLAAVFSYINYRYIRLPSSIGLMLIALCMSLVIIALGAIGWTGIEQQAESLISTIDFSETLMHGMLSFLLFAGALHIDINDLLKQKWVIGLLATAGIMLSTAIVGLLSWLVLTWLAIDLPLMHCMLFGALISPTDPIAVLGILRRVGSPASLETKITGESLFNDGVGVVVFLVLLGIVKGGSDLQASDIVWLFLSEAGGGMILGLLLGVLGYWMLSRVDQYQVEVLITLAMVMGGYTLATAIHVSGPIAMVVAGLMVGNHGRLFAMSERTREHVDTFWELIDETLNTVLFVLIGLEVLVLVVSGNILLAALCVIPIVLLARFLSVGLPVALLRFRRAFSPHVVTILTWGGLRGGISVALALSVPAGPAREQILVITYAVVVFSILVQGLTIGRVIRILTRPATET